MAKNYNARKRERMMAEDPHCYWCGIEVIYYELKPHEKMPFNFATIDHLYDKFDFDQRLAAAKNHDETRHVLACNACNKKRNKLRQDLMSKSFQQIRSKLGQERKDLGLINISRPTYFRGLIELNHWDRPKRISDKKRKELDKYGIVL